MRGNRGAVVDCVAGGTQASPRRAPFLLLQQFFDHTVSLPVMIQFAVVGMPRCGVPARVQRAE